ncbi:unnamed protein product, partial [Meganyctiphanes norvegica]
GSQSLVVPCVAHGHPAPHYRWYHDRGGMQVPLPPYGGGLAAGAMLAQNGGGSDSREGVLLLEPGRLQDPVAVITCEATNSAGKDSMEVRVERSAMGMSVSVTP